MPFFAWLMFRLTSHWKQFRISGSSRIGNDLPVQAHPALDNSLDRAAAIEPLRSSSSTGNTLDTFADPQFTAWAQQNYPNTLGTKLLDTYLPIHLTSISAVSTAANIFPGTCGTPATNNLPCSLPMIDQGGFN